jgi:hypothetical protein
MLQKVKMAVLMGFWVGSTVRGISGILMVWGVKE